MLGTKKTLEPTGHVQGGVTVEHTDNNTILGHPAGLFNGFGRSLGKFQTGEQHRPTFKAVILKGKVFGHPPVQTYLTAQPLARPVQHIGGRIQPGQQKPLYREAAAG